MSGGWTATEAPQLEWAVSAPDGRCSFALIWKSYQVYEYFPTPTQAKISQIFALNMKLVEILKGSFIQKWIIYNARFIRQLH